MAERRPIFISYRREDEPGYAGWLYQLAADELGADQIFKDIEGGLRDGDDFPDELARRVEESDILLSVVGPKWLTATDEAGRRRLDNPADWVRIEIAAALDQQKRVIPVLVNGAPYLRPEDLPDDMQALARKQTRRLSNDRFAPEAKVLISGLETMIEEAAAERADAALRAKAESRRREQETARQEAEEAERRRASEAQAAGAVMSAEAIEVAKELANWNFIADRNDAEALRDHLSRYPDGQTAHYARTVLEELVWAGTDREDIESLQDYLAQFPDGPNAEEAQRDLQAALDQREERLAAHQRATEERLAWAEANVGNDKRAIRAFLQTYPDGQNADAARKRLRELSGLNRRVALVGSGAAVLGAAATWQMQPGNSLWRLVHDDSLRTFTGHEGWVTSIAFAPDGKTALSGSWDETPRLWDIASGDSLRTFTGHGDLVLSVAFAPDGKTALSGSLDNTLRLWDIATGDSLRTFTGHEDPILSVAFAPDGKTALSGAGDGTLGGVGTLRLWNIATGDSLRTFSGDAGGVWSVAFSPDGKTVLAGGGAKILRMWDIATGDNLRTFIGHESSVPSVRFAPNGKTALSGSSDGTLRLWDVATGDSLRTFTGHADTVWSVAFAPDGKTALSGSRDNTLRLWDITTGDRLHTFTGHEGSVNSVAFAPDGKTALSGSDDNTLKLWRIPEGLA